MSQETTTHVETESRIVSRNESDGIHRHADFLHHLHSSMTSRNSHLRHCYCHRRHLFYHPDDNLCSQHDDNHSSVNLVVVIIMILKIYHSTHKCRNAVKVKLILKWITFVYRYYTLHSTSKLWRQMCNCTGYLLIVLPNSHRIASNEVAKITISFVTLFFFKYILGQKYNKNIACIKPIILCHYTDTMPNS